MPGPVPATDKPGIAIPGTVERLVLLGDSTSDAFSTQCVIARAAARFRAQRDAIAPDNAARPLDVVAAWSPAGQDFDDLLREAA